jgi:MFS family permease
MWTLYGNIATFYPPYKKKNHPTISDTMVGLVLSMFEFGILTCSPLVTMTLQKVGRKNYILIGNLFTILPSIGFGLLVYVESDTWFFVLSLVLRYIQGFGDAAASIAIFSIIGSEYVDKQELYFGYFESAVGIGMMLGPVIGQLLYNALDFEYTFYCTAIIIAIPTIWMIFTIPNRMNKSAAEREQER